MTYLYFLVRTLLSILYLSLKSVRKSIVLATNSNRKAQSVPDAPRVTNTTPPTPPQTASIAGNPTIIPSVTAGAPPQKNADVTNAARRYLNKPEYRFAAYYEAGQTITIGVHHSEADAFYANPVEYGHGGPAPAPAHPFVRPAFDVRQDEAYSIIRDGLRDAIDNL